MPEKEQPKKRGRPAKVKPLAEEDAEAPLKAIVLQTCNNPTWCVGKIDGFRVNIKVPAQMANRLLGKEVNVVLVQSDAEDYYQYIA